MRSCISKMPSVDDWAKDPGRPLGMKIFFCFWHLSLGCGLIIKKKKKKLKDDRPSRREILSCLSNCANSQEANQELLFVKGGAESGSREGDPSKSGVVVFGAHFLWGKEQ